GVARPHGRRGQDGQAGARRRGPGHRRGHERRGLARRRSGPHRDAGEGRGAIPLGRPRPEEGREAELLLRARPAEGRPDSLGLADLGPGPLEFHNQTPEPGAAATAYSCPVTDAPGSDEFESPLLYQGHSIIQSEGARYALGPFPGEPGDARSPPGCCRPRLWLANAPPHSATPPAP